MAKKQVEVWVAATRYKWSGGEVDFALYTYEPNESFEDAEHQLIGKQTIEVEVPDNYDFDRRVVETLEAKKKQLMAEFHARIVDIDRQIQEHLALPMPAVTVEDDYINNQDQSDFAQDEDYWGNYEL